VRTLADDRFLHRGTHPFVWDGRGDDGVVVPDGIYHLRVGLRSEGRSVTAPRPLFVDTKPPRPRIVAVTPATILPGAAGTAGRARIRFSGPSNPAPKIRVWRTDGPKVEQVAAFDGRRGRRSALWDGMIAGAPAPAGSYAISVTVADTAGNRGSAPAVLPPVRSYAAPGSGVSVSYFTLTGPSVPARPGSIARFVVGPVGQRTSWRLAPYGRGGAVNRGTSSGGRIAVRVPRNADSDLYSVFATSAGGRHAGWPLTVSNRAGTAPVLVVIPMMTWLGQNAVDSNQDGFPDTLDSGDAVPLARGFLHGAAPRSVSAETVPLLAFLARIRANYDLTTDVALAAGHSPTLAGHRGVVFAGSERWMTQGLAKQLRAFVRGGGNVASFGVDALRRQVGLAHGVLRHPQPPRAANVFGERTAVFTNPDAPLVVSLNKLDLFPGTDGFIGSFTRFERSDGLDRTAVLLAAAGRGQKPDLVAYRLGRGLVFRLGTDQWAGALAGSPEAFNTTRRIWALLSQ
jgi:hypothetical protein